VALSAASSLSAGTDGGGAPVGHSRVGHGTSLACAGSGTSGAAIAADAAIQIVHNSAARMQPRIGA
jgi:hypothetical protein